MEDTSKMCAEHVWGHPSIALCGIDGAGKSTTARALVESITGRSSGLPARYIKNTTKKARDIIRDSFNYDEGVSYLQGPSSNWYALCSALDFLDNWQRCNIADNNLGVSVFDRYKECFVAFANTVSPPCSHLVSPLLSHIPPAGLTILMSIKPSLAWERIRARTEGPSCDESLPMLERFDWAYREMFKNRRDIVEISATASTVEIVEEIVRVARSRGCLPATMMGSV
jgi:thymidylate kinase